MILKWKVDHIDELKKVADELLRAIADIKILCFQAEMAAGKTTFIKVLCKHLGIEDEVTSPTFSIVNEYEGKNGEPVYHFDFYRLKNIEEAFDLGYEDYIYSGNYCFIEWPEKVESLLSMRKADIFISVESTTRYITCNYE